MISRRHFAASAVVSAAFLGLARRGLGQDAAATSYRNEVPGYGDLVPDRAGLLDLPGGFSYRIISSAGERMDDGYFTPSHFDGMGCFAVGNRRVALVRNHELSVRVRERGPAGDDPALAARLLRQGVFGTDNDGCPLPGGTTTLVYDMVSGRRERQHLSLSGTLVNCAGGTTPWGSWLSCEESTARPDEVAREHGWVFEVPSSHRGLVAPEPLRGMGRFRHEAAAIDPRTGIVYLTEDREDSLFYRFIPRHPRRLRKGGRLQALGFAEAGGADTRNWTGIDFVPRSSRDVRWIDLDEVESPGDDLRQRGRARGAAIFARGEGIHHGNDALYFTCTSGGRAKLGQIMRYVPSRREGHPGESRSPGRMELFVESTDPKVMDYADNLTVAPNGHLIVCEDRAGGEPCHLKGVAPDGRIYTLARLNVPTELAGACFSPDGRILFVNVYHPGKTLAISGPWRAVRT
ncbi:MAG TPA: alkaline phosphatase PhoX [Allosphingosinicella sp.]|nr:alkaline phosphatase PhoX [Allosphingosinicella sp.]